MIDTQKRSNLAVHSNGSILRSTLPLLLKLHRKGTATEQNLVIFHPRDLQRGDAGAWMKKDSAPLEVRGIYLKG